MWQALNAATSVAIPTGRTYYLGTFEGEPMIGSLISGVALVRSSAKVRVVRVHRLERVHTLGEL